MVFDRDYDFDSIIMGTSMLENTAADSASKQLGGTWANLSMSAATYYEKYTVLDYAMRNKNIRRVIMSLDDKFDAWNHVNNTFDVDLYSGKDTWTVKLRQYTNKKALRCIFLNHKCRFVDDDLNHPNAWFNSSGHARRFGGFDNWLKVADTDSQIKGAFDILLDCPNNDVPYLTSGGIGDADVIINDLLVPMVKDNPSVQFEFVIPPYSALYWAKSLDYFDEKMAVYANLVRRLDKFDNVRIYWFYDADFVFDIAMYKDLTHYHQSVNEMMLHFIRDGRAVVEANNIDAKIDDFRQKLDAFDLDFYIRQIKQYRQCM